jgi:hypothetical protein
MKKLLVLLLSILFLCPLSVFAKDISDFEIEGISIGDSLLDFMTKEEILEEIEKTKNDYLWLKEPNKYAEVYLFKDFPTYDAISFFIKNNSTNQYVTDKNEKFPIVFVRGLIDYTEDFDSCIQKKDEIIGVLTKMFPNLQLEEVKKSHSADSSGNSKVEGSVIYFSSISNIQAQCNDFEESFRIENKLTEGLSVAILSEEISEWLNRVN